MCVCIFIFISLFIFLFIFLFILLFALISVFMSLFIFTFIFILVFYFYNIRSVASALFICFLSEAAARPREIKEEKSYYSGEKVKQNKARVPLRTFLRFAAFVQLFIILLFSSFGCFSQKGQA